MKNRGTFLKLQGPYHWMLYFLVYLLLLINYFNSCKYQLYKVDKKFSLTGKIIEDFKNLFLFVACEKCSGNDLSETHVFSAIAWATFSTHIFSLLS